MSNERQPYIEARPRNLEASPREIKILYEDDDCAVVDKPSKLMVHSDGRDEGPFLTDWILEQFPMAKEVGEPMNAPDGTPLNRSGIIHRLDRETSGAIIIAKTQAGYLNLKEQFQERTIKKKYLAFLWGEMREQFGTINRPIGRSKTDFRRYSAQRGAKGEMREAETYWSLISRFKYDDPELGKIDKGVLENTFSLVEAEPKTGRTHQIRVHFNAIHHPVVGDSLYAPNRPMVLGFQRLALHSRYISFETLKGERVEVKAPLPEDFKAAYRSAGIEGILKSKNKI